VRILSRVLFAAKAEPAKAGPRINWFEIESRLQEISAQVRPSNISVDRPVASASNPLATAPSDDAVTLSPYRDIFSDFQAAAEASAAPPSQSAGALSRVRAFFN
jgi:hypothetical protein